MDLLGGLAFVVLGMGLGTFGTIIGAGGGFLLVPILLLLGWPHTEAAGTSLLMVTANAASGSISYWRQKRIDLATGWRFALATVPGAIIGSQIVDRISGQVFNIIFAALLIALAVYLFLRPEKPQRKAPPAGASPAGGTVAVTAPRRPGTVAAPRRPAGPAGWGWTTRDFTDAHGEHWVYGYSLTWGIVLSFGVGFMSSILGIGGGIIHVPSMINLFNFPAHVATATSHFVLAISAATGTAGHLSKGDVRIPEGLALGLGAIVGAQIGGALSSRVKGVLIVRALAVALVLVGVRLLFSAGS